MDYFHAAPGFWADFFAELLPQTGLAVGGPPFAWRVAGGEGLLYQGDHLVGTYPLPLRVAAVVADLRWQAHRAASAAEKSIRLNADFTLLPHDFALAADGQRVTITGREVALLQFLRETGESSKETLLQNVWHYHPQSDTHTVETHLWRLRQKVQAAGITAALIVTTANGYRIA